MTIKACESVDITITEAMAAEIEKLTVNQFHSPFWHKYRAGGVTASQMKVECQSNSLSPSSVLVKKICYPESFGFQSKATEWGNKMEKPAKHLYVKYMQPNHHCFAVHDSGLSINPCWGFLAASPDGKVKCHCCGEVKCPFKHRGESIEAISDPQFCLTKIPGGVHLDHGHAYYYQVQTQLHVCSVDSCDFVVCTFSSADERSGLHIERILRDSAMWTSCILSAEKFFYRCLLSESDTASLKLLLLTSLQMQVWQILLLLLSATVDLKKELWM